MAIRPTPYPLSWPANVARTKVRLKSRFSTSLNAAMNNVKDSLRLFGDDSGKVATEMMISSNVTLGVDKPNDPGVAVWFMWHGAMRVIAIDRYGSVMENLQAIHHIIEARRTEARHGGLTIVEQTFAGFTPALPSKGARPWHVVLKVAENATRSAIDAAYRNLAKERHPDTGTGSHEAMAELNAAYESAKEASAQ